MKELFTNSNDSYTNDLPLEYNEKKDKKSLKSNIIFTFVFFGIILLSIIAAGMIGKNFMSFFMFYLFFGFPLMIVYKDQIISLIPSNIASYIVDNVQEINKDIQDETVVISEPIKNKEYLILFIGVSSFILSVYILFKRRHELIGIFTSLFFCILSNIIIGDLF
jgi:hypothetical protein